MSSRQRPSAGGDGVARRRNWGPFRAEVMATASLATWGLWALCVLLLVALLGALAVAAARVVF